MWRFRKDRVTGEETLTDISIHQMWRFRELKQPIGYLLLLFQYIKCGGSASIFRLSVGRVELFQYIKCGGSATLPDTVTRSVINFNTSNVEVPLEYSTDGMPSRKVFQYIKCGGSAYLRLPQQQF